LSCNIKSQNVSEDPLFKKKLKGAAIYMTVFLTKKVPGGACVVLSLLTVCVFTPV
jgi:hypothetical protein